MRIVRVVNTHDMADPKVLPGEEVIFTHAGDRAEDPTADNPRLFPDACFSVREGIRAPRAYHPADDEPMQYDPYVVFPDPQWAGLSPQQQRTL